MGRGAALFKWESGDVRHVVYGRRPVIGRDRGAAAPGGNLPEGRGVERPRPTDLPGRGIRTVVQRVMDHGASGEHHTEARRTKRRSAGRHQSAAAELLSPDRGSFRGGRSELFYRLAGAS